MPLKRLMTYRYSDEVRRTAAGKRTRHGACRQLGHAITLRNVTDGVPRIRCSCPRLQAWQAYASFTAQDQGVQVQFRQEVSYVAYLSTAVSPATCTLDLLFIVTHLQVRSSTWLAANGCERAS